MKPYDGHRSRSSEDERGLAAPQGPAAGRPVLRGSVRDRNGDPVPGALVAISAATSGVRDLAIVADPQGRFDLPPLPPGLYEARADSSQGTGRQTFHSASGSLAEVEIVIEPPRNDSP
jgi:hypothetical protein